MDSQSSGTLQSTLTDSSKTGSSKSGVSGGADKDRDLTKDNAASPIDLECHIQQERITKIIDEAIYKVKLSLCLPKLIHEFKPLQTLISPQHMEDLIFIYDQYENPLFSTSLLNVGAMEDIKGGDVSLKNRLNPELGHLLYILNSYPKLKPIIEEYITEMKVKYVTWRTVPPQPGLEYLLKLEHFRDLMVTQMSDTAAEVLGSLIHTRKVEASNTRLKNDIKEYSDSLKEELEAFEKTVAMKSEIIKNLEQELMFLQHEATSRLKKQILDSDRQMVLATRAHAVKHELLTEESVESKEAYENILRRHMLDEKNQRARRFKVETQLVSWIQKYDTEMADKQIELDEFDVKYEEELEKCEKLEKDIAEQDKEFVPLMEEREKEYHQEMSDKMEAFLKEHAARVIQVAWRDVLANRAEKKKLKKLIKKKIAEEEAAAAAAELAARKAAAAEKKAAAAAKKAAAEEKKAAALAAKQAKAEGKAAAKPE